MNLDEFDDGMNTNKKTVHNIKSSATGKKNIFENPAKMNANRVAGSSNTTNA